MRFSVARFSTTLGFTTTEAPCEYASALGFTNTEYSEVNLSVP